MAILKALRRGGAAALGSLSQGMSQLQAQRLEEARLKEARAFQERLAEVAFQRQKSLQDDTQEHAMEMEIGRRRAALEESQRTSKLALGTDANTPGADPSVIASRALGLGMGDEFFPGTGSRINMPDDPRLSPEFRGKSLTHFAMPIRPSSSERPPIEQLLQQAMQSERTGLRNAFTAKQEEFEAQPHIDESGNEVAEGPDGSTQLRGRTTEQEGKRQAGITDIGTPAAGRRAFTTARQSAAGDPAIVPILGSDGATNSLARVGPTGGPDIFAAAPLTGANAGGTQEARAGAIGDQLARFKELSEHVNKYDGMDQRWRGISQWFQSKTGEDLKAEEFSRVLEPLGIALAVYTQGSRPTDTDARIMTQSLGGFMTSKTVAQNLIAVAQRAVELSKRANPGLDLDNMTEAEIEVAMAKGLFKPTMTADQLARLLQSAGGVPSNEGASESNTVMTLEQLRQAAEGAQ